jgi:hypothetical protein
VLDQRRGVDPRMHRSVRTHSDRSVENAQSVAAITVNRPGEIETWTGAAISASRPWRGMSAVTLTADADWTSWQEASNAAIGWTGSREEPPSGLLALKGVGYPMASAILDILDPQVWPVIDKWAAKIAFGIIPSRYSAARYAAYARHLATEGTRCWGAGLSIHGLDMRAQAASMKDGHLPGGWRSAKLPPP